MHFEFFLPGTVYGDIDQKGGKVGIDTSFGSCQPGYKTPADHMFFAHL